MEGGICQGVSSDDPALVGAEYVVIDYDVEGADMADITEIEQSNGDIADAVIGGGQVEALGVTIQERV
jgi:hypothetical protein